MMLEVTTPSLADAVELSRTLRAEDRAEIAAGSGDLAIDTILEGMRISEECQVAKVDGRVMAIWGIVPGDGSLLGRRSGVVWMLTSELVNLYPKLFWQGCKTILPELLDRWDVLLNGMYTGHSTAIRWARRLGFQLEDPVPWGHDGALFHPFWVTREVAHV